MKSGYEGLIGWKPGGDWPLRSNPIIYAEIASGFATIGDLDRCLVADAFRRLALPYEAGFVVGRAFVESRRRGGFGPRRFRISISAHTRLSRA